MGTIGFEPTTSTLCHKGARLFDRSMKIPNIVENEFDVSIDEAGESWIIDTRIMYFLTELVVEIETSHLSYLLPSL